MSKLRFALLSVTFVILLGMLLRTGSVDEPSVTGRSLGDGSDGNAQEAVSNVDDIAAVAGAGTPPVAAPAPRRIDPALRELDPLFKAVESEPYLDLNVGDFDFLRSTERGDRVSFRVKDKEFRGVVSVAKDADHAYQRVVGFDDGVGRAIFNVDGNGIFRGDLLFSGDSRVIRMRQARKDSDRLVGVTGEVSDLFCAPKGSTYEPVGTAPLAGASKPTPITGSLAAAPPVLTSSGNTEYVIYIDFDGERVENTIWNGDSSDPDAGSVPLIDAAPHPKANDVSWVTAVWNRVAEDFAPFDITVTTDRSVFDAADPTKRVMAIVTPTGDWYPIRFPEESTPGGVAYLGSFNDISPIVWVFNQLEYSVAETISHEVGHSLKLSHDGRGVNFDEYYGGHGSGETSWAPIMGAAWSDGTNSEEILFGTRFDLLENVTQWSQGEYDQANNGEDDVGLIADTATTPPTNSFLVNDGPHGFGFKTDDYADSPDEPGIGEFTLVDNTQVSARGVIETRNDIDIFEFSTVPGIIDLNVHPIDVMSEEGESGSDTQGANLAVRVQLLDAAGAVLADVSPNDTLGANLRTEVEGGNFYLAISGAGRGTASTGFTDYASLGEYAISGSIAAPPLRIFGGPKSTTEIFAGDDTPSFEDGTRLGFVVTGSSVSKSFRLENTSSSPITNIAASFDGLGQYEVISTPSSIPANGSATITVRFLSGATGLFRDSLRISYDSVFPERLEFDFAFEAVAVASRFRDNYEYNNAKLPEDAYNLTPVENVWLSDYKGRAINGDFVDWYRIDAEADDLTLFVEVDMTGTQQGSPGDMIVTLHDSSSESTSQVAFASINDGKGILRFAIPESMTNRTFYVRVTHEGTEPSGSDYDLRWSGQGDTGPADEDLYEENDSLEEAYDLTQQPVKILSRILGPGIQKDEDWYKIEVPRNPRLRFIHVECDFDHSEGDIDIELWGPFSPVSTEPSQLAVSDTITDREMISYANDFSTEDVADDFSPSGNTFITGVLPGTYYIRVRSGNPIFAASGTGAGNEYDLSVELLEDDNYEVVDAAEGTENDLSRQPFDLGGEVVGRFLSAIDGFGVIADYANNADVENFNHLNDEDWYRFSLADFPGTVRQFTFTLRTGASDFIAYEIREANGTFVLQGNTENSTTSFFDQSYAGFSYSENSETVTEIGSTEYLIKITASDAIGILDPYDFRIDVSGDPPPPPQGTAEDNYEENDNFFEPFDLGGRSGIWLAAIDGYGFLSDNDWYRIEIPNNAATFRLELVSDPDEGDIDMSLFNENEKLAFRAEESGASEVISWENPKPGAYLVGLSGDNAGTRYNLRWTIKRTEDNYEPNDSRDEADARAAEKGGLVLPERTWLRKVNGKGIQADEDWYRIIVDPDTRRLDIDTAFDPTEGDIDLELYDEDGFIMGRSVSSVSTESISLDAPEPGVYYIRLYFGDAGNEYDLYWAALTQEDLTRFVDDPYEQNDTRNTAFNLGADDQRFLSDISGLATMTDDDWYQIAVGERSVGLDVVLDFVHAEGDIDLELYDSTGRVIALGDSVTDDETIKFGASLPEGDYFLRVFGVRLGQLYDLFWLDRTEDIYEPNDSKGEAFDITSSEGSPLSEQGTPTQGDDDWYRVSVGRDGSFLSVELSYVHANGNIDFEVRDSADGFVAGSATASDFESVFKQVEAGDYFIKVFGDDAYNDYDLTWRVFEDDVYENNDDRQSAADIKANAGESLTGAQFDPDWYQIEVLDSNATLFVDLSFVHADGNIDLALFDDNGDFIDRSAGTGDQEAISLPNPATGNYFIKVSGEGTNPQYTLVWNNVKDDAFEENDAFDEAADISGSENTALDLVELDDDWFRIDVPVGDVRLEVNLEFLHEEGDLTLELFDAMQNPLAVSATGDDDEQIVFGPDPDGASYYAKVSGPSTGTAYTLTWSSSRTDGYEGENGNNLIDDAFDLSDAEGGYLSELEGQGSLIDEDWYRIEKTDESILVQVEFTHAEGNIDIELFRETSPDDPVLAARSATELDVERIVHQGENGTYYIRVFGDLNGNAYDLFWRDFEEDDREHQNGDGPENDVPGDAVSLIDAELSRIEGLTQLDDDWYRIAVEDGDRLSIICEFEHSGGDIDLELYAAPFADGDTPLLESKTQDDGESIDDSGLPSGDYLLRVHGKTLTEVALGDPVKGRDLANRYDLRWNSASEDAYDLGLANGNNTLATAFPLPSLGPDDLGFDLKGDLSGEGVQFDPDYYRIDLALGNPGSYFLFVDYNFDSQDGELVFELLDSEGESLALDDSNSGRGNFNRPILSDTGSETFYIKVTGEDFGQSYNFGVSTKPDDRFEDNDSLDQATDLTDTGDFPPGVPVTGLVHRDPDYYKIKIPSGLLRVQVGLTFDADRGDLDVTLLDAGGSPVASENFGGVADVGLDALIPEAGGTFYILVGGENNPEYELFWNFTDEDRYEENDDSDGAFSLTELDDDDNPVPLYPVIGNGDALGEGTQTDEDWYSITVPSGHITLFVDLSFIHNDGDLSLAVFDNDGSTLMAPVADSADDDESLTVSLPGSETTYFVRVAGPNHGNRYSLTWNSSNEDLYEENDFVDEAFDLTLQEDETFVALEGNGLGATRDDDWYVIVVSDGSPELEVTLGFSGGTPIFEVYRLIPAEDDGSDVDRRRAMLLPRPDVSSSPSVFELADPNPGLYYVRVSSLGAAAIYSLTWRDGVVDPAGDEQYTDDLGNFTFTNPDPTVAPEGFYEDIDGDTMPGWAEFALSTSPTEADTVRLDQSVAEIGGEKYYVVSFIRSKEAANRDFVFRVQESETPSFEDYDEAVFVRRENVSVDKERVVYRSSKPIGDRPACFFKLSVSQPESGF